MFKTTVYKSVIHPFSLQETALRMGYHYKWTFEKPEHQLHFSIHTMLKKLELALDGQGIVVFDPYALAEFVEQQQITDPNLFQRFLDDPEVGNEAIRLGLILPIYTLPAIDYQIIFNNSPTSVVQSDWKRFTTRPFPLAITSGKVVVADIYSVMEWDAAFFQELVVDGPPDTQAATTLEMGNYSVIINGFSERNYVGENSQNIGYEFCLQPVAVLPVISKDIDIENFDFELYRPGQ